MESELLDLEYLTYPPKESQKILGRRERERKKEKAREWEKERREGVRKQNRKEGKGVDGEERRGKQALKEMGMLR